MNDEEIRKFIADSKTIILVSNGPDGVPHPMPMWFVYDDDGTIRMTTYAKSQKIRNLERDPRVALLVESGTEYEELATNKLDETFDGTAAIVGDEIYLRGRETLYCIGASAN